MCSGQQEDYSQRCHSCHIASASHRVRGTRHRYSARAAIYRLSVYIRAYYARFMVTYLFV